MRGDLAQRSARCGCGQHQVVPAGRGVDPLRQVVQPRRAPARGTPPRATRPSASGRRRPQRLRPRPRAGSRARRGRTAPRARPSCAVQRRGRAPSACAPERALLGRRRRADVERARRGARPVRQRLARRHRPTRPPSRSANARRGAPRRRRSPSSTSISSALPDQHRLALPAAARSVVALGGAGGDVGGARARAARGRARRRPAAATARAAPALGPDELRATGAAPPTRPQRGQRARRRARCDGGSSSAGGDGLEQAARAARRGRSTPGQVVQHALVDAQRLGQRRPSPAPSSTSRQRRSGAAGASALQCAPGSAASARLNVGAGCPSSRQRGGEARVELRRRRTAAARRARTATGRTRRRGARARPARASRRRPRRAPRAPRSSSPRSSAARDAARARPSGSAGWPRPAIGFDRAHGIATRGRVRRAARPGDRAGSRRRRPGRARGRCRPLTSGSGERDLLGVRGAPRARDRVRVRVGGAELVQEQDGALPLADRRV